MCATVVERLLTRTRTAFVMASATVHELFCLACLRSKCLPAAVAPMTNLAKLMVSWCVVLAAVFLMRMASVLGFATIASFSKIQRILDLIGLCWKNKMCHALSLVVFRMHCKHMPEFSHLSLNQVRSVITVFRIERILDE